jgi:tetratricopeptide (TPR) repeat protein
MLRTTGDDFREAVDCIANGRLEDALPLLARVVAFDSSHHEAYELWVGLHIDLDRHGRAIELADEGLARGIAPIGLHVEKSRALVFLGRHDEAERVAEAALALDPISTEAVLALADVAIARRDRDAAIRIYQDALRRNPDDDVLHLDLLRLLKDLDQHQVVIDTARDFLRRFGKTAEVLDILGQAHVDTKEYRRADRAFRDAADLNPDDVDLHVNVLMLARFTNNDSAYDRYLDQLGDFDEDLADRVAEEVELLMERIAEDDKEGAEP